MSWLSAVTGISPSVADFAQPWWVTDPVHSDARKVEWDEQFARECGYLPSFSPVEQYRLRRANHLGSVR